MLLNDSLKEGIKLHPAAKRVDSHSFDKGFLSKNNLVALQQEYATESGIAQKRQDNPG